MNFQGAIKIKISQLTHFLKKSQNPLTPLKKKPYAHDAYVQKCLQFLSIELGKLLTLRFKNPKFYFGIYISKMFVNRTVKYLITLALSTIFF